MVNIIVEKFGGGMRTVAITDDEIALILDTMLKSPTAYLEGLDGLWWLGPGTKVVAI